jgi:hypothetical protein
MSKLHGQKHVTARLHAVTDYTGFESMFKHFVVMSLQIIVRLIYLYYTISKKNKNYTY